MFFNKIYKLKPTCEVCGLTPQAPRKRCPDCSKLVCISQCWNKKVGYCNNCSSNFLPAQLKKSKDHQAPSKSIKKHSCKTCGILLKRDNRWGNYGSRLDLCDGCHKRIYNY